MSDSFSCDTAPARGEDVILRKAKRGAVEPRWTIGVDTVEYWPERSGS
jgi:hypothetical protein